MNKALEWFREEVRSRAWYRALTARKFASPKGYVKFEDACLEMASDLETAGYNIDMRGYEWTWICALDVFCRMAEDPIFPVYRIDRELIKEAIARPISDVEFGSIQPHPIERGLFLLPKGAIGDVDFLAVDIVDSSQPERLLELGGKSIAWSRLSPHEGIRYRWVTQIIKNADLYASSLGYDAAGQFVAPEKLLEGRDRIFTDNIASVMKAALVRLDRPCEIQYEMSPHKRRDVRGNSEPIRYPIRVGMDSPVRIVRVPPVPDDRPEREKRRSPVAHVRKKHYRRVPVGPRSEGRRELREIRSSKVGKVEFF